MLQAAQLVIAGARQLPEAFTWREMWEHIVAMPAPRPAVSWRSVRDAVRNLERAGVLVQDRPRATPGCKRPLSTYRLAPSSKLGASLQDVWR